MSESAASRVSQYPTHYKKWPPLMLIPAWWVSQLLVGYLSVPHCSLQSACISCSCKPQCGWLFLQLHLSADSNMKLDANSSSNSLASLSLSSTSHSTSGLPYTSSQEGLNPSGVTRPWNKMPADTVTDSVVKVTESSTNQVTLTFQRSRSDDLR